jgi:hypothetical protein
MGMCRADGRTAIRPSGALSRRIPSPATLPPFLGEAATYKTMSD